MPFRVKSATIKLMKIALASDLFWPMINGISVFTKNLAEQMAKRGHEVVVFAPSQNGDYYVEEVDGYKVVRLSSVNFPFYPNQTEPLAPPRKSPEESPFRAFILTTATSFPFCRIEKFANIAARTTSFQMSRTFSFNLWLDKR